MVVTKIIIKWTSFSPVFPDVISNEMFDECKFLKKNLFIQSKFIFLKLFKSKLMIVGLALLFICSHIYNLFPLSGWKSELLIIFEVPFFIVAFFIFINVVLSAISYICSYVESKNYEIHLSNILFKCNSYEQFCIEMCEHDKRYVIHIQRMA